MSGTLVLNELQKLHLTNGQVLSYQHFGQDYTTAQEKIKQLIPISVL